MGSHGIPLLADSVLAEDINKEWDMVDGNVITGQARGSAMEFAFQLVEILLGRKKVREVNKGVLAKI